MNNVYLLTSYSTLEEMRCGELASAKEALGASHVVELLSEIPANSLVVPRFRAIPFGDLLQQEVELQGSTLVNTYAQHRAIANSSHWVGLLDGSDGRSTLTPRQYGIDDIPHLPEGEWFVKGETNSIKNKWLEGAYAPTTKELTRVTGFLMGDSYVGSQNVVIKPFQPYRRLATGLNSQPIFHERRVFILDGRVLTEAFYWSSWVDEVGDVTYDRISYEATLQEAINRIGHIARFIVIDLAEYETGEWGVVELNDGAMSGLSENDPTLLWQNFLHESMLKR